MARDRGALSLWVAITTPALLLMLMLVVDSGAKIKAGEQADTYSAEAARAAVLAIGPRAAGSQFDLQTAVAAANTYLRGEHAKGTVSITGAAQVRVTVTVTRTAPISGASFTVTRSSTAQLLVGVDSGEAP